VARTNANNNFTVGQTVTGTLTATSFSGIGSGLTNVTAVSAATANGLNCTACVGNTQLGIFYAGSASQGGPATSALIATTAGSATTAVTAATATNALSLGGILASNFARLDIGNSFTGNQIVTGNVSATGLVSGATASFTGALTAGGAELPFPGTATGAQGFNSNPLDLLASSYNGSTTTAVPQLFRWQAEPAGNDTASPSGSLNLLFLSGAGTPGETGLSIAGNGLITFASGQTFPGTVGGITGITTAAGSGLTGGGLTGTLSMAVDSTVARTNINNNFSVSQTVTGTVTATSFVGNGSGITNITATSTTATSLTCTGCVGNTQLGVNYAGSLSKGGPATSALTANGLSCAGCVGNSQLGVNYAGSASKGGPATSALTANSAESADTAANALSLGGILATNYARLNIANTFTGNQSVDANLSTTGTVTIGSGGTPIVEHLSLTFNPSFAALAAGACSSANFDITGVSDGNTTALGVPNERMTGGGTLMYTAWVSAANTITIRACNISPSVRQTTPGTGAIRVDVWKH
jgi:hypothetical protein